MPGSLEAWKLIRGKGKGKRKKVDKIEDSR